MNTRRHLLIPTVIATTAALALTACGGNNTSDDDSKNKESVSIATPKGFDTKKAVDAITDLPADPDIKTAVSDDGQYLGYAYKDGKSYKTGQIDLSKGKKITGNTLDHISDEDDEIAIEYAGDKLAITHTGTTDEHSQWDVSLLTKGSDADAKKISGDSDGDEVFSLTETVADSPVITGTTDGSTSSVWTVDTSTGEKTRHNPSEKQPMNGCHKGADCSLPLIPEYQHKNTTVSTFKEPIPAGSMGCTATGSTDTPACLTGFKTDQWSSQDPNTAPDGANPDTGRLVSAGNGYIIGAWSSQDHNKTLYKLFSATDPTGSSATVDGPTATNTDTGPIHASPNNKHFTAGSLVFDLDTGKGANYDGNNDTEELTFASIDNDGTAYGTTDDLTGDYASRADTVYTATTDGQANNKGENKYLPVGFTAKDAGIFISANDAVDNKTAIGIYRKS